MSVLDELSPHIAIIIPVYNVEKYIKECLDSVLKQTYRNFTIFAIDDGSTDSSGKILDDYAKKDSRIKVIHKKNEGICVARNTGLDIIEKTSEFDYIGFIDNDDIISLNYLSEHVSLILKYQPDYTLCGYHSFDRNGIIPSPPLPLENNPYNRHDALDIYFSNKQWQPCEGLTNIPPWGSLYSRELVKHIRFKKELNYGGEDDIFRLTIIQKTQKIAYSNKKLYFWRLRKSSSSHRARPCFCWNYIDKYILETFNLDGEYNFHLQRKFVNRFFNEIQDRIQNHNNIPFIEYNELKQFMLANIAKKNLDTKNLKYYKRIKTWPLWLMKLYFFIKKTNTTNTIKNYFN